MQNIREKDIEAAYVLIDNATEPTLDDVNAGSVANVSKTMYMAYDEGGQRIWTAFRGAGVDEEFATMPGVGKYYAQHVTNDVGFTMTQMDLVAGGFRDVGSGIAYYPVTDMQGNVRSYASTAGLQGAIDYYAYGTSSEIMHGNVEDNKRWQGKEEDGSIRKLYFGSRYFDPFFGMWLTPDPAGQFANPYTYGGDPVNYVDPNGEIVHVIIGAVVGAVVGTVQGAIQCTAPGGGSNCGAAVGYGFFGGAAVGAAAAATGGAAAGAIGGLGGAIAGGAVGGAVNAMGNYAIQAGVHKNFDSDEFWFSGLNGAITGAVGGGFGYYSGATASLLGGFSTGVVGSALNGDEPWDVIKSGIWGAALAGASYLMNVGKLADDDFTANQDARETLAKETGFDIRGVDDLYNEQSSVNPKMENADKQEFYITDDDIKASAGRVYKTEEGNWRNNVNVGEKRTMHAHGSLQPERKPTPGDLYSAAKYSDRDHYMLDVPTSTVYKYNGNHINGNVDYSAAEGAAKKAWESGKNIERTWSYKPYKGYDEYYKGYFKW